MDADKALCHPVPRNRDQDLALQDPLIKFSNYIKD